MPVDLSAYTIRLANEAQEEEHWRACFVPWNRGKDWQTFRMNQLKAKLGGPGTADGAFKCWVLVKRDDFDGPMYSGCESYRRKSLLRQPGEGQVENAISYALASVATPVPHLRNGFATHLLRLLHYHLASPSSLPSFPTAEWGAAPPALPASDKAQVPPGFASILWSDVGSTFYERATIGTDRPGWTVAEEDCQEIVWQLNPPRDAEASAQSHWIYEWDLSAIAERLSVTARQRLSEQHASPTTPIWSADPSSPGILSFVPHAAELPPHSTLENTPCGIRLPPLQSGQEEAIVLFVSAPTPIGNALLITCAHNLDAERLPALLAALDAVGMETGMKEGHVWGVKAESELGKAWLAQEGRKTRSGRRPEIHGHLLGVAWYGPPAERGKVVDTQMWTWC